jgi:beta-galactosidase
MLLKEAPVKLNLPPQQSVVVRIPLMNTKAGAGDELYINFEVRTREAEPLIPVGHIIAYDQFILPVKTEKNACQADNSPALKISGDDNIVRIASPKVEFIFDKRQGIVTTYKVDGKNYFAGQYGIRPNFWRAPTDNDYGNGAPKRLQIWKQSSKELSVSDCHVRREDRQVWLTAIYRLVAGNDYMIEYKIYPSGIVRVTSRFMPIGNAKAAEIPKSEAELLATHTPLAEADKVINMTLEIPRIGIRFRLPVEMNTIRYYGRGPQENYCDRHKGSRLGLYETTAEQMYTPYVRPQENGHRTDVRWLAAISGEGKGLLIQAEENALEFNALRNSIEDFDGQEADAPYQWNNFTTEEILARNDDMAKDRLPKRTHINDIIFRNYVEVCIDMQQQGVGGYDSWGSRPIKEATIFADKEYCRTFTLIPVVSIKDIMQKVALKY